jgi:hypothetical protein
MAMFECPRDPARDLPGVIVGHLVASILAGRVAFPKPGKSAPPTTPRRM